MARLDLMAAIHAAAAEMQNATVNDNKSAQRAESVRPKVQPSGAKERVQPKAGAQPKAEPKAAPKVKPAIDLAEAIKAAAESVRVKPKTISGASAKGAGSAGAGKAKVTGKAADTTAEKKPIDIRNLQCKYAIPDDFKMAIRLYMESRAKTEPIVKQKMAAAGKSIEGCCEYIYGVMMRRAAQQLTERKNTGVGLNSSPEEVYGLAMHYYDETDEALKAELNGKEG